jgi:hypothetical protein
MQSREAINARLRALGRQKPTMERRAEVEALLGHKWEGVQTVAAHVLGEGEAPGQSRRFVVGCRCCSSVRTRGPLGVWRRRRSQSA